MLFPFLLCANCLFVVIPVPEDPASAHLREEGNESMKSQKTDLIIALVLLLLLIE